MSAVVASYVKAREFDDRSVRIRVINSTAHFLHLLFVLISFMEAGIVGGVESILNANRLSLMNPLV